MTEPLPDPELAEQWLLAALQNQDVESVRTALYVIAIQKPQRARQILRLIQGALDEIKPGGLLRL